MITFSTSLFLLPMRRFVSVFMLRKKDEDRHPKRSWKSWLRRPENHNDNHDNDNDNDDNSISAIPLQSLIQFTTKSLVIPPSVPPFVPDSMFPRSVNHPGVLPRRPSLRIHVLKSAILHNFETDEQPSSVSDFPNISRPPISMPSSPGIRRWLSRPCFEDRNVVYTPLDSGISMSQVSAPLPVAAIEYSDYLAYMAHPAVLRSDTPVTGIFLDSIAFHFIHHALIVDLLPSPLRTENLSPPSPSDKSDSPPPMTPTTPPTTIKRVVRFAADEDDDDDDDGIPLHLIRQKKLREQKAKFIKQERLRRAREQELNSRQREKEGLEKARERSLLEAERAQAEKERKQKEQATLAEEVVKARLRRELHRAGGVPALLNRDRENDLNLGVISLSTPAAGERNKPHLSSSSSTASLRGGQVSNLRKDSSLDPPSLHLNPQQYQTISDSSPGSSRPSSMHASTNNTPSSLYQSHFNSRPPSSYSSSSESIGRRNSLMPLMGSPAMAMQMNMMPTYAVPQPIIMSYPSFASSNPNISYNASQAFSPVPNSFVDYNNMMSKDIDMQLPLLPPAAPFMKQPSYERRKALEKEGRERNSRPASLRSVGSKRDSVSSMAGVFDRERENHPLSATIPRTGKPSALGAGSRNPIPGRPGQGHIQNRSSSGPVISSSTNPNLKGRPFRASTMPTLPPVPSPWTGVPTAEQRQQQAQLVMSNGASRGGQSVSGGSSSTVTKRGSIMSGFGKSVGKSKSKPSIKSSQGQSQVVAW